MTALFLRTPTSPDAALIPHVGGNAGTGPRSISEACTKPRGHCGPAVARGAKAAGDCRTPKPRGGRRAAGVAPASWSAVVLHRFGRDRPADPTGGRADPARWRECRYRSPQHIRGVHEAPGALRPCRGAREESGLTGSLAHWLTVPLSCRSARGESGRGLPHSKTSRRQAGRRGRVSVLECGGPPPLWSGPSGKSNRRAGWACSHRRHRRQSSSGRDPIRSPGSR